MDTTGKQLFKTDGSSVSISKQGLIAVSEKDAIKVYSFQGKQMALFKSDEFPDTPFLDFPGEGHHLVACQYNHCVLFNVKSKKKISTIKIRDRKTSIFSVTPAYNGKHILVAGQDPNNQQFTALFNMKGQLLWEKRNIPAPPWVKIQISPDGKHFAITGIEGKRILVLENK